MKKCQHLAIAAALLLASLTAAGGASADEPQNVVLRLRDSGFEFSGELKSFDGARYVVKSPSLGLLSIEAARFECEGAGCAHVAALALPSPATSTFTIETNPTVRPQVFAIDGSGTIGLELMPALIRDYASSFGGSVKQMIGGTSDELQFRLSDARGGEISTIELKRQSSANAFGALSAGKAAIGMSSRPISVAEAAALPPIAGGVHGPEGEVVLALDALAVLVAPGNPVKSLSIDALAKIASGKITNWLELGLPPGVIKFYAGSPQSAAIEGLDDLVLRPRKLTVSASATRFKTEIELSDAVARDPQAIGVASLAFLRNARALAIADACGLASEATVFSVKSEEYPLGRRLYLYTGGLQQNSVARGLLTFASSAPAQATVQNSQFIDQAIEQRNYSDEDARFNRAVKAAESAREVAQARAIVDELKHARRLSATLRFASGSSQLDAKARDDVVRLRALLKSDEARGKTAVFVGYTDSVGSAKSNIDLSYRRATQIRQAVAPDWPSVKPSVVLGEGPLAPVACDESDDGQRLNRRVEVWLRD